NFELEDYEAVERDTEHILELLDFVQDYAVEDEIGQSFQQFRPQTIMMQIRAIGTELIAENNYNAAIDEITDAIEELNQFYTEMGREELVDSSMEVHSLSEWLKDVEKEAAEKKPMTQGEKLQHKLNKAVEREDYEAAAKLRDQLTKLDDKPKS
ncbi:MAG: UvrB/UvrC motif-containing protein, partial [Verrucomicrobiota bacterium]|nr:UvrB/UvrC motif-containing protein [Verrucomicrobiota bacterium]